MADEFNPQNRTRYYFAAALADPAAPTVAEVTGAIDLSPGIMRDGVEGFERSPGSIDATTIVDSMETSVRDISSVTPGAFLMKRGSTSDSLNSQLLDEMTALLDTTGYVVMVLDGVVEAGALADVHPATVGDVSAMPLVGGQIGRYRIPFNHPADSVLNTTIAAGV